MSIELINYSSPKTVTLDVIKVGEYFFRPAFKELCQRLGAGAIQSNSDGRIGYVKLIDNEFGGAETGWVFWGAKDFKVVPVRVTRVEFEEGR